MHKDINVNVSGPMQPTSTYKTVVLKGQVPFASQVTEPNTKYVIKHNFDLGGENITIPENCVLEFDGGSLSNGTIDFNNAIIDADNNQCIFNNLTDFGGITEVSVRWFGAKGDRITDDTPIFRFLCNRQYEKHLIIRIPHGVYRITGCINENAASGSAYRNYTLAGEEGRFISEGNDIISAYDGSANTIIYCTGNVGVPFIYAPNKMYNLFLRGEDNNDRTSYKSLLPLYNNTIGIELTNKNATEVRKYYTECSLKNIKLMFFGTAINQSASFALKFEDIDIYRNYYGWKIDTTGSSQVEYITSMYANNIHIHLSVNTGLSIKCNHGISHISFSDIAVEHSNINNVENEYEIYIGGTSGCNVSFNNLYTESIGNESDKVNIYEEKGRVLLLHPVLYRGKYVFDQYVCIISTTSYDANVKAKFGYFVNCYLNDLELYGGNIEPFAFNSLLTESPYYNNPAFAINEVGLQTLAGLRTYYANRNTTPLSVWSDTTPFGFVKINGKEHKVPIEIGAFLRGDNADQAGINSQDQLYVNSNGKLIIPKSTDKTVRLDVFGRNAAIALYGGTNPDMSNIINGDNKAFMYFNTVYQRPFWWTGNKWLDALGHVEGRLSGTSTQRPSNLTVDDAGFLFYDGYLGKPIWWTGSRWVESDSAVAGIKRSGTFAQKPAGSDIYVGYKYFCTDKQTTEGATDGIEIIYKGNDVWVDALGRVVS